MPYWMYVPPPTLWMVVHVSFVDRLKLVGRAPPPVEEDEDEKSTDDVHSSGEESEKAAAKA